MKDAAHRAASLLREEDSNFRPLGYEPNELPLLHPAVQISIIRPNRASSTAQKLYLASAEGQLCSEEGEIQVS